MICFIIQYTMLFLKNKSLVDKIVLTEINKLINSRIIIILIEVQGVILF